MVATMMHIVNNVFLPRKLPQEDQSGAVSGGVFVRLVTEVLAEEMLDIAELGETARLMSSWVRVQQDFVNWEAVNDNIKALLPGQTFALHMHAQNSALTISIPANERKFAVLAVFRVAASSAEVMGAPGNLSAVFPGWAVTTYAERVQNVSFAKQVADLANTPFEEMLPISRKAGTDVPEKRDVADASFVTEWLLSAVAGHSLITGEAGVTRMRKKIRDDVLWMSTLLPWRRSGEYMTVKVVLQSTLVGRLGAHDGLIAYKLIMVRVLTAVLVANHVELETDLILQMLSKVARRLSKLKQLTTTTQTTTRIHLCVQEVLKISCQKVIDIRVVADGRWQRNIEREALRSRVLMDTNVLDFRKHVKHLFLTANPHFRSALAISLQPARIEIKVPHCLARHKFSLPDVKSVNSGSPVNVGEALYDIELWVRSVLWPGRQEDVRYPSIELFGLLIQYINGAKQYYNGDALGASRMILTTFTIVAVLDCVGAREHLMLLEYNPGVDTRVLQHLLLPHRDDMKHLVELEDYFVARDAKQVKNISLISEDEPSEQAFAVRFAQQDRKMQRIKDEILEFARQEERKKLEEVDRKRKRYYRLLDSAGAMSCNMVLHWQYDYQHHEPSRCQRCRLMEQASAIRVDVYEFPLPTLPHLQDAVVYELVAPISLLILRDSLHILSRDVCGIELDSRKIQGMWLSHKPLENWIVPQQARLTTLCSTSKLFKSSHYSAQHPSSPDDDFIKPNGFNLCLMEYASSQNASVVTYRSEADVSGQTTLDADGAYKCLQWTIDWTSHTENQVLARQVQCPPELNLAEYKVFGTLRAGHRLQVRNIVRVLEMQTLSLFQPSVVNLFAQALWQTGPAATGEHPIEWIRDSNLDLREESFGRYVSKQLLSWVENSGDNWKDHLVLLSIVIIGARVLAISEVAWEQVAANVLCRCRAIAEDWLNRVEEVLGTMMASPIKDVQKMRSKLVDIAAIAALTFDVDARHLKLTMRNSNDAASWLRAVASIHDNTLLNSESAAGMFQRNLLRRVQNTALCIEETLNNWLTTSSCLDDFVLKHWADADQGQIESWVCYGSPSERWWKSSFKHFFSGRKMILQMDTLRGSFLVDGCPVARLPESITGHQDYNRVFGSHVFQVQPAAASSGAFVSVHKLKGAIFTFALAESNRLVVQERRHDGRKFELFPSRFLKNDLPENLVVRYSHWILKTQSGIKVKSKQIDPHETDGRMVFRPVKFDHEKFSDEDVPFVLSIGSSSVHDMQRDRDLVDVRSSSFRELYDQVLFRLELPQFVHVFVEKSGSISAELPRMGLGFDVDPKSGIIWSHEQPGFVVSREQTLGTLVGLRHGLLLKEQQLSEKCASKQSVIIPHSCKLDTTMENYSDSERHPVVKVNLARLSSPSFFVFDVDDRLQCLRGPASPTAWLYLALLHATTAHSLPDPFTGLTGTEAAMRLLQSPRCWSCNPYEPEAISILLAIANLSPTRNWYPKHLQCMQTIRWPEALFSLTALDAFYLVVAKLIEDSERLRVLFPNSHKLLPKLPENNRDLLIKSYWRSRETIGQEAQMNYDFEEYIGGLPVPLSISVNLSARLCEKFKKYDLTLKVRSLAEAGHTWGNILVPRVDLVRSLLLDCSTLSGALGNDFSSNPTVSAWRKIAQRNFSDYWLDLYNFARTAKRQNRCEEFTLFLSLLAFRSVDSQVLVVLLCVAFHTEDFEFVNPPLHQSYVDTKTVDFDTNMTKAQFKNRPVSFDKWRTTNGGKAQSGESEESFFQRQEREYRMTQVKDTDNLAAAAERHWAIAKRLWPNNDSWQGLLIASPPATTIDSFTASPDVWSLFTSWLHNRELHNFVSNVEMKLLKHSCRSAAMEPPPLEAPINHLASAVSREPFRFAMPVGSLPDTSEAESIFQSGQFGAAISNCNAENLEYAPVDIATLTLQVDETSCKIAENFNANLRKSWIVHHAERHKLRAQPAHSVTEQQLTKNLSDCKVKSISLWTEICNVMKPRADDMISQAFQAAGLWRRVHPAVLLPCLLNRIDVSDNMEGVRVALGALAVVWTLEQQAERCLRLLDSTTSQSNVALQKELANNGHVNWSPKYRPEWLILELEGDYLMRPIQVDVAERMLHPLGRKNAVLQLNMGEGKTSVIVPALCASIPVGQQFARLTVLSSLFRINFDALAFKLGGLLNRRVYTFPCRRDMRVDARLVERMRTVYQECIAKRGVVVTRPEHRLSAQLMVLELCRAGAGPAAELRDLQNLVNSKARDILDESDLILQVKYQVVYTTGEQMNIDGGVLRWKVSQCVLRSAQHHCSEILSRFGAEAMEFKAATEGPFAFPHIRLLNEAPYISLCEMIADDILAGGIDNLPLRELRGDDARLIRSFILPSTNADVSVERIHKILPDGPVLNTVLILRGLLLYGVLLHSLGLRWRVQFGVRPSGQPKMAVPFRAKDVPVERAEFGHPDVAIMLTQLSYYNSGLSDEQLLDAFERLNRLATCAFEYKRWLEDVPAERVPESISTLSSVNLEDFVQRTDVLFPILRRNMRVIDFWLSTAVFPVESKQFEGKLVASAWDLCGHAEEGRPVSGFSGTKDTSLLLPPSIIQRDLYELQGTDGAMIENLLRTENSSYQSFPSCISSLGILEKVVASGARVLLDVGALMVDLSNEDVALKWLGMLSDNLNIEAAIYFASDNQIMAVDRDGRKAPLPLSPYHRQMARCVVYLDDVHTRGTDLKIPHGYQACVTLGRGITKDRLVQACMRMRMLGEGHSVSFWASQEVHTSIVSIRPASIGRELTSTDVLHWVTRNSVEAIKDGFRHWGSQGIAHCRKLVVNHLHDKFSEGDFSLKQLGHLNTEEEITRLSKSYGGERRIGLLPSIMKNRLQTAAMNLQAEVPAVGQAVSDMILDLGRPMIERIDQYAAGIKCFAQVLDEEQERELEHELEEEEEVQRPLEATPRKPVLSPDVRRLATDGYFNRLSGDFWPLLQALQRTSLLQGAEPKAWSNKLFVTSEFATVLSDNCVSSGVDFLRPVAWLAVVPNTLSMQNKTQHLPRLSKLVPEAIVLLSPFEVNMLMSEFRRGRGARLHMVAPRLHLGQDFMLCERALTLPILDSSQTIFDDLSLVAQLLAFSGGAFFANDREQSSYCDFLGLCPRPRNEAQEHAFQQGDIKLDGFILPEKRGLLAKSESNAACSFQESPVPFMADLLSARGWLGQPSASHVGQILSTGQCPKIGNKSDGSAR